MPELTARTVTALPLKFWASNFLLVASCSQEVPEDGTSASATCIFDPGAIILQIGVDGVHTRVITGGLVGLRDTNNYPTAKALADSSWMLFPYGDIEWHYPAQMMMAKLPPFTVDDVVDRTTFVRVPLSITAPIGLGVATAVVEFGYAEFGTPAQHYCTSRKEACVAAVGTVVDATPFQYATTDTYSRLACVVSCTITLPVLPMHTAFYQVKFYTAGGSLVTTGETGVASEGTAVPLP